MSIKREEFGKLKPVTKEDDKRLQKEADSEDHRKYRETHRKEIKEHMHQHYLDNKEEFLERSSQWYKDNKDKNREEKKEYLQRWQQTEKGKTSRKKVNSRRRGLGFLELNEPFEGCIAHHINENTIIYIPEELHQSIYHNSNTGQGMIEINNAVVEWLIDIGDLMPMPS